MSREFFHDVLVPLGRLKDRAFENLCIDPESSDVLSQANQVASAVYHFWEVALRRRGYTTVPPMGDERAEKLRQILCDVADTSKHGSLRNSDRTVDLHCAIAFELNPEGKARFVRTEINGDNARHGKFEVIDVIDEFLPHLKDELGIVAEKSFHPPVHDFSELAVVYTTADVFPVKEMRFRIYKRDDDQRLVPFDPEDFTLVVLNHPSEIRQQST